jgi:YD repeat-containing protein
MITFRTADAMAAFHYSEGNYIRGIGDALTLRLEAGDCVVENREGATWHFEVKLNDGEFTGKFLRAVAAGGRSIEATYDKSGRMVAQVAAGASPREKAGIYYEYFAGGAHGGRLKGIEARLDAGGKSKPMIRSTYCYYEDRSLGGAMNDLKSATSWLLDSVTSKWAPVGTTYYRYYVKQESPGFASAVKLELAPDAVARLELAGADIDQLTDEDLAPHASIYREYDGKGRVTLESRRSGEEWRRWSYLESDGAADRNWDLRMMETSSDGTERASYFDKDGLIAQKTGQDGNGAFHVMAPRMQRALKFDAGSNSSDIVHEPRTRTENLTRREGGNGGAIGADADRKPGDHCLAAHEPS